MKKHKTLEELGFKRCNNERFSIRFEKELEYDQVCKISFKKYVGGFKWWARVEYDDGYNSPLLITQELHMAIHMKLKELGWLDEAQ